MLLYVRYIMWNLLIIPLFKIKSLHHKIRRYRACADFSEFWLVQNSNYMATCSWYVLLSEQATFLLQFTNDFYVNLFGCLQRLRQKTFPLSAIFGFHTCLPLYTDLFIFVLDIWITFWGWTSQLYHQHQHLLMHVQLMFYPKTARLSISSFHRES